jgi:calcium/calmodulin-dependent protein kinase I
LIHLAAINTKIKNARSMPSSFVHSEERKEPDGVLQDVALKTIPKKKVKGNEASVWGEMEVLKGLEHPNIVRLVMI